MTFTESENVIVNRPAVKRRAKKKLPVFEFLNSHAKRDVREIDKSKLKVPTNEYQRDESEGRIANEIAMHFDLVAFSVLLVIERANGELVVADGGTRLSAALMRADVSTVLCVVFSGLTDKQEADVFLRVNNNRRKLQTDQLHHAELFSDHDLAVRAQMLLDMMATARVGFESLATMRHCVSKNSRAAGIVTHILTQVAFDKHVTARVMKGLVQLETVLNKSDKTLDKSPIIKRMMRDFGKFDAVVNAMVKPQARGSAMDMARAIARTLHIKFPVMKG